MKRCEELLFALAHVILDVAPLRAPAGEEAVALATQRTKVYDATMALLEACSGTQQTKITLG